MENKQFEIRDQRKGSWVWIDKNILLHPLVSATDLKVYAGIAMYASNVEQNAWPGVDTLAEKLNIGRTSIFNSLKVLQELKIIQVEKRIGLSNLYTLIDVTEQYIPPKKEKAKSPHHNFIRYFYETAEKTRNFKPAFSVRDGAILKRILSLNILQPQELEQLALYFLAADNYRKFTPTISTFLSAGILNGLQNTYRNNPNFWKELDGYSNFYQSRVSADQVDFASKLEALKSKLTLKVTQHEN